MNKKILSGVLALSMFLQIGATSFAYEDVAKNDSTELKVDNVNSQNNTESGKSSENVSSKQGSNASDNTDVKKSETEKEIENPKVTVTEATPLSRFLEDRTYIKRIAGSNRVSTSVQLSRFENSTAKKVIIADASQYPDALSASNLTEGKYPVLLVSKTLSYETAAEIERLKAEEVIILGGYNSISGSVEDKLSAIPGVTNVKRIYGSNRFETCNKAFTEAHKSSIVFASGENFPDALASSSLIGEDGLLLTRKNTLPESLVSTVANISNKNVKIVGGDGTISPSFVREIKNMYRISSTERIAGQNRYDTSVNIAHRISSDTVILASGTSFPDALAASTLSQQINSPIVLVEKDYISPSVQKYLKSGHIRKVIALGGESSISGRTIENVYQLLLGKDIVQGRPSDNNSTSVSSEGKEGTSVVNTGVTEKNYSSGKFAVTKKAVSVYADEELTNAIAKIPSHKIVDVISNKGNLVKINYNGAIGWVERAQLENYDVVKFGKVVNHVPYISQLYPVYAPNGCEPTSLLMALQGKGYTKMGLREFLDKMPKTKSNPKYGYVGVPYNVEQGRFQTIDPEPLAKYGRKYGNVVNIQGAPIEKIIREIQNGNTVVAYETLFWQPAYYRTLPIDGVPTRRIWNNHVLLLTGYDPVKQSFYIADPYNHERMGASRRKPFYYWKSKAMVDKCYNYDNRRFAVVIR